MTEKMKCISCGKDIEARSIIFLCPSCGKSKITRCSHCKKLSIKYKCKCGFEGP